MLKSSCLSNTSLNVVLLNYGARIATIHYQGQAMTLSYKNHQDFISDQYYLGATIGPIANRIRDGQLVISDKHYQLPQNEFPNCLHSGNLGLDQVYWQTGPQNDQSIEFHYLLDLSTLGLQGELNCRAQYQIDGDTLRVRYLSSCSNDTYINITNHVYFNLNGGGHIDDHEFTVLAQSMRATGTDKLPTKQHTVFDKPQTLSLSHPKFSNGIDHHFNMNSIDEQILHPYIKVSTEGGVGLCVYGTAPGFQLYTGGGLNTPFLPFSGFCVEPQYTPNAINCDDDYSPILKAGECVERIIEYRFSKTT